MKYYTEDHEWIEIVGSEATIGLSEYAANAMGEVTFVELPEENEENVENDEINELTKRNRSREWVYSDKRYLTSYSLYKRKKYPFGIVSVDIIQLISALK